MLLKNAILELKIDDIDCEGLGISHLDGYTIFVKNALVDEVVKALILKVGNNIAFAKTIEVLKRSEARINPRCSYSSRCGGCNMQHMTYTEEMRVKTEALRKTIHKMVPDAIISEGIPAKNPEHYRNKIQLPVGYQDNHFVVGFYQERSHNIIASNDCLIEHPSARIIINEILALLNESNIYPYDEISNTGDLRHLILRVNSSNEFMVVFVVMKMKTKIAEIIDKCNNNMITSYYVNINSKKTNVILGEEFIHVKGKKYLNETLFGNTYLIHPNSFFQVNYEQMKILYTKAIELLNPRTTDVIIDAYCGIGTITLTLAKYVKKVYGIEVVKEAILNANQNKERNAISNAEFVLGKCEEKIKELVENEHIDAIVMDPPRKGSDKVFLDTIINTKIPKIIYISCGPASLARDLKYLSENNYKIDKIVPVDMFPRTANLETVATLSLRK